VSKAQLPSGIALERTIVSGTATAKINERLHEQPAPELLVLGTHGHGGFKRLVLGSVAEATARYASAATLVIP
jgi:nucleotide-binding universal stress UspA family protein